MEWTVVPFDWNPRALLLNVARAWVFPSMGRTALGRTGALRECAACVVDWAGSLAWAAR